MLIGKITRRLYAYFLASKKTLYNFLLKLLSNIYQLLNKKKYSSLFFENLLSNRATLDSVENFIEKKSYESSNDLYGLPRNRIKYINKKINQYPTYTDLLTFFPKALKLKNINYVEIGVSVLKNFYQISNSVELSTLYAFDINDINPSIAKNFKLTNENQNIKSYNYKSNKIHYYKGDVFNHDDLKSFSKLVDKANIIFSDANHSPEGVLSEFDFLIKNILDDNFLIYYDDLNKNIENAFNYIVKDLGSKYPKINVCSFLINGWLGQNEKMHRNGFITNTDYIEILERNNVKLLDMRIVK